MNIKYDIVRCIAIIFVICIHSMSTMNKAIESDSASISIRLIWLGLNSIVNSGVPLFVMLSGALLLGKTEPISMFFKKRLKKLMLPFLVWSVIVFILTQIMEVGISEMSPNMFLLFLHKFLTVGSHGIYWYIYLIIGLYLLTPVLRVFYCHANNVQIYYSAGIMLLITFMENMFPEVSVFTYFSSSNLIHITYFIMGYVICKYLKEHSNRTLQILTAIVLLFSILCSIAKNFFVVDTNFPWMFLTSVSLFTFLMSISYKKVSNSIYSTVNLVSSTSYGIYLSHFMFISLFVKLGVCTLLPLHIEPIVITIATLLADISLMYLIKKVKLNKFFM